jgi:hypothetical protein
VRKEEKDMRDYDYDMRAYDYDTTIINFNLRQVHPLHKVEFHKKSGDVVSKDYIQAIVNNEKMGKRVQKLK